MVSIRITIFVLMFSLLHVRDSSAHTDQAMEKKLAAHGSAGIEVAGRRSVEVEKEFYDGVPAASEVANTRVGGRKMMSKKALGKKMVKAERLNGEDSKNSGAAHSVGNCDHRGNGILNVECKLRKRSSHPVKVKRAGFTAAFSADYHVPKSHPPKNN